jgi:lipopolysaccharide biosynthesis protein
MLGTPKGVLFVVRTIALYLPQFHPIPENDRWWGKGFTEWTNVAKAKPLFAGHYQPHVPADLGFYDLRLPEVREAQAELARAYGIEGFCYYHYWLGDGRRLLERPFNEVLESGAPDFPFCLCWANHSWSGIWYGEPKRILMQQTYPGEEDDRAHFAFLLKAFRDKRYIRVRGRPVFLVFQPEQLPEASRRIALWRRLAQESGIGDPFILGMRHNASRWNPHESGFDGAVDVRIPLVPSNWGPQSKGVAIDHSRITQQEIDEPQPGVEHVPCVGPTWDNTPRLGARGIAYINSTPGQFRDTVSRAVTYLQEKPPSDRLLFIKAWNEWAEGNHLEPDLKYGHQWLEALQQGTSAPLRAHP